MNFGEWEGIYEKIIDDFGYSIKEDQKAAEILQKIKSTDTLDPLRRLKGKEVEIIGPFAEKSLSDLTIIAGSAISTAIKRDIEPYMMVTDLDGDTELQVELNREGVPIVVHAHGDNIKLIKKWVPKLRSPVICTCQSKPLPGVYNFGGFTDGDRAVMIADEFEAKKIILNGWDFDNPVSDGSKSKMKKKKLRWAKKIIERTKQPVKMV